RRVLFRSRVDSKDAIGALPERDRAKVRTGVSNRWRIERTGITSPLSFSRWWGNSLDHAGPAAETLPAFGGWRNDCSSTVPDPGTLLRMRDARPCLVTVPSWPRRARAGGIT